MKRTAIALSLLLCGCSSPPPPEGVPLPDETAAQQAGYVAYGGAGQLSASQEATLKSLAWPQSYSDMVGTFGLPSRRNGEADIYRTADGRELTIIYDGDQATGYQ